MSSHSRMRFANLVLVTAVALTLGVVQRAGAGYSFVYETSDSTGVVGRYNALALDPADRPGIAYFDSTNFDLKFARKVGVHWSVERVDSVGIDGRHTSLLFDEIGNPHVSYEAGNEAGVAGLGYATRTDVMPWAVTVLDGHPGTHSSMARSPSGLLHISYYDTEGDGRLGHAFQTSPTDWDTTQIDTPGDVGRGSSIAFAPDGTLHVCYELNLDGNNDVKHARSAETGWEIETVDGLGGRNTITPSIAVDAAGIVHLAYGDLTDSVLVYRIYTPGLGWSARTIVDQLNADRGIPNRLSLALDSQGRPRVAYVRDGIRYAECNGGTWESFALESGEGSISLKIDATDSPHLSYYDPVGGNLRYARGDRQTELAVVPDGLIVYRHGSFTLGVEIRDAADLGAFQFDFPFDDARMSFVGGTLDTFLASTGREVDTLQAVSSGLVAFGGYSYGLEPGPSGTGWIAKLAFDRETADQQNVLFELDDAEVTDTDGVEHGVNVVPATVHFLDDLLGDFNDDCEVTVTDIMQVASRWLSEVGEPDYDVRFDVSEAPGGGSGSSLPDGRIDVDDIGRVAGQWGAECGSLPRLARAAGLIASPMALRIEPAVIEARVGDTVTVDVIASGTNDLGAFEVALAYDADQLAVEKVLPGTFLAATGNKQVLLQRARDVGEHAVGAFTYGANPGASGEGIVAQVRLRILECGTGRLDLAAAKALTHDGSRIPSVTVAGSEVRCGGTSVPPPPPGILGVVPNPARAGTEVAFATRVEGQVRVEFVDVRGRLVQVLADGRMAAGRSAVRWAGIDQGGSPVPAGLYFAVVTIEGKRYAQKVLVAH